MLLKQLNKKTKRAQTCIDKLGLWCCHQKYTTGIMFFLISLCAAAVAHRYFKLCALRRHFRARDNTDLDQHNFVQKLYPKLLQIGIGNATFWHPFRVHFSHVDSKMHFGSHLVPFWLTLATFGLPLATFWLPLVPF